MGEETVITFLHQSGCSGVHRSAFGQDTNFWIFLCFGQSNMEGFPGIEEQDKTGVDDRLKVFAAVDFPKEQRTRGTQVWSISPLCRPSTGLCPADYLGRTLVSNLLPRINVMRREHSALKCKIELFRRIRSTWLRYELAGG